MCIRKNSNFVALIKPLEQLDMRYRVDGCRVEFEITKITPSLDTGERISIGI